MNASVYNSGFMFQLSLLTHTIKIQLCDISCVLPKISEWLSKNVLLLLYLHRTCALS